MKRMSDYTGEAAIELWADIFDPVQVIAEDKEVQKYTTGDSFSVKDAAKVIMKKHKKEAFEILNRIDPEINGANAFMGVIHFVTELVFGENSRTFFKSPEPEKSDTESSGSATENTEDGVK